MAAYSVTPLITLSLGCLAMRGSSFRKAKENEVTAEIRLSSSNDPKSEPVATHNLARNWSCSTWSSMILLK